MSESYCDGPYRTFTEAVAGALDNKENFLVALGTAGAGSSPTVPRIQLVTGADSSLPIGVMFEKLKLGDPQVTVRLLGKGGTVKMVAGGVIAYGAYVKSNGDGTVVLASTSDRGIGIKLTPGSSAANDVIEVLDIAQSAP